MFPIKRLTKKIIPKPLLNLRHLYYAWHGAVKYGYPSEELLVIGITGTSGKSSTAYILRQLLEASGFKVGSLTTIDFYVNGEQKWNDKKMTMLGKMEVQRYLRKMVNSGCDVVIIETTSEGAVQHRHKFINYDMILLTNLYPEHIESHGSYEKYKKAKLSIFAYIAKSKRKVLKGMSIDKTCIVNKDIKEKDEFTSYNFEKKKYFSNADVSNEDFSKEGLSFSAYGGRFHADLYGHHNVMNLLLAIRACLQLGVDINNLITASSEIKGIPGRIEFIEEAKEKKFNVIVDYAFEPVALGELYKVVEMFKPNRVIHVSGNTGGGRDKPFEKAKFIANKADVVIITNEDPYHEDPVKIINNMADIVESEGMVDNKNLFRVEKRREGIRVALSKAREGDMVLVTGKGSEQAMVMGEKLVAWDDRQVVRELLSQL